MSSTRIFRPDTIYQNLATKELLFQFPVGLRKWGMSVTITDDPIVVNGIHPNNTTWVLVKGLQDDDKSNNDNWAPTTIPIGIWNMVTTDEKRVPHGQNWDVGWEDQVTSVTVIINNDLGAGRYPLLQFDFNTGEPIGGFVTALSGPGPFHDEFNLWRFPGGFFTGVTSEFGMNSNVTNRGFIALTYR